MLVHNDVSLQLMFDHGVGGAMPGVSITLLHACVTPEVACGTTHQK